MNWCKIATSIDHGLINEVNSLSDAGDIHEISQIIMIYTWNMQFYIRTEDKKYLEKAEEAKTALNKFVYKKKKENRLERLRANELV